MTGEQISLDESIQIATPVEENKSRCTPRKHLVEKGEDGWCDCKRIMLGLTAAGNAHVITILHV